MKWMPSVPAYQLFAEFALSDKSGRVNSDVKSDNKMCVWLQLELPCSGCRSSCGVLATSSGTLSDGSGLYTYPSDANCQWLISPDSVMSLAISILELDTESCCDFLRVFRCVDASCQNVELIAALSGTYSMAQTTIATQSYAALVQFSSDGGVNGDGFLAHWATNTTLPSAAPFLPNVCIKCPSACIPASTCLCPVNLVTPCSDICRGAYPAQDAGQRVVCLLLQAAPFQMGQGLPTTQTGPAASG
jgi:hypothetical protein